MGALSVIQWIQIAGALLKLAPEIRALFAKLAPVLQQLLHTGETAIAAGASHAGAAEEAGTAAHRYANQGGPRTHGGHQDI